MRILDVMNCVPNHFGRAWSRKDQTLPDGVARKRHPVVNAQSVHDSILVTIDGFRREVHDFGDFLRAESFGQMPQHFQLAG